MIRLADLPRDDNADVDGDPGCDWHPRRDKTEAWTAGGLLADISDDEIGEHFTKPEAFDQPDGWLNEGPFAAEDSALTPEGEV